MTTRRRHRVLGQIGDMNPIDHAGGIVVVTDYGPVLEWTWGLAEHEGVDPYDEGVDDVELTVYRVDVADDVAADLDWVDWSQVARSIGMPLEELIGYARSENPLARAQVIESAASYYGWHEFDLDPARIRYGDLYRAWFPRGRLAKRV